MTLHRLSLGHGYDYLIASIARGDGAVNRETALTAYYSESGTPPGVWLGRGVETLGDDSGLTAESVVTEDQLFNMLVAGVNPAATEVLGRKPNEVPLPPRIEIQERLEDEADGLTGAAYEAKRQQIVAEVMGREAGHRPPVAGFDLTFSPPKSVSVLWALSDQETQQLIHEAHREAIKHTLAYGEQHVFCSRSGTNGVVREAIDGVSAASFTHYDSRDGDPQLHDHVVVWNRARCSRDGQWRTLDSRQLHKRAVELSECYDGALQDILADRLGVRWSRAQTRNGQVKAEIQGVPKDLMVAFSQRTSDVDERIEALFASFAERFHREPTRAERFRLQQQATLQTRKQKTHRSLSEMTGEWRHTASKHVQSVSEWAASVTNRPTTRRVAAGFDEQELADASATVLQSVCDQRSTFTVSNVAAEAERHLRQYTFVTPDERRETARAIAQGALVEARLSSPPELRHVPEVFTTAAGESLFRPADQATYTTNTILTAEEDMLTTGRDTTGPSAGVAQVVAVAEANLPGRDFKMTDDQALAVEQIATSGRRLDVLVGPAGTGKSTTMAGLKAVWEREHGKGSVIGIAPSASTAETLGKELGVATDNLAKWVYELRLQPARVARLAALEQETHGLPAAAEITAEITELRATIRQWELHEDQLVIVDESSLASTTRLSELMYSANDAGAKVLLVGDQHQLGAVEAGGMFGALVKDRDGSAPELTDVRRFTDLDAVTGQRVPRVWEQTASLRMRTGDRACIDAYETNQRIIAGDSEDLIEQLYAGWKSDTDHGLQSLMIAGDTGTVNALNMRARQDLVDAGIVAAEGVPAAGDTTVGVGDLVCTRQNDRRLRTQNGFVKNNDLWEVTDTYADGSVRVRRQGGGGRVTLPARYVAEKLELAYSTTAHRAQGRTVDTAHAMVTASTNRELLYVGTSRGKDSNRLYVQTSIRMDDAAQSADQTVYTARDVLEQVLANSGRQLSAHEQIAEEWDQAESIPTLFAEYQTLAAEAEREKWMHVARVSVLPAEVADRLDRCPGFAQLTKALERVEDHGADGLTELNAAARAGGLDVDDPASVLHRRVRQALGWDTKPAQARPLLAGLTPRSRAGREDPDMLHALEDRETAITDRAQELVIRAARNNDDWIRPLLPAPTDQRKLRAWGRHAGTVAAYRELYDITGPDLPDPDPQAPSSVTQARHVKLARHAFKKAAGLAQSAPPPDGPLPRATRDRRQEQQTTSRARRRRL